MFEQSSSRPSAHENEDDESRGQPDRARVARARVSEHGEHPDHEGQRRTDESRDREPVPANGHVRAREVRPREIGLADPQPDDGELGSSECNEDAERVEAREERGVAVGAELGDAG